MKEGMEEGVRGLAGGRGESPAGRGKTRLVVINLVMTSNLLFSSHQSMILLSLLLLPSLSSILTKKGMEKWDSGDVKRQPLTIVVVAIGLLLSIRLFSCDIFSLIWFLLCRFLGCN